MVFVVDNLPEKELDPICKVTILFKFPNSVGRDPSLIELYLYDYYIYTLS